MIQLKPLNRIALHVKSIYRRQEKNKYLLPLLQQIIQLRRPGRTVVIGIQGGQGTGKTTLSRFLQEAFTKLGYSIESFSIDDFYTSYQERQQLARKYLDNPFYQIARGMPGTHRVNELQQTFQKIKARKPFTIPVFDKSLRNAAGDVAGYKMVKGKQEFIIFEGWCVGLPLVSWQELLRICRKNRIKAPSPPEARVLLRHTAQYQALWKFIDYFIMLKPTSSKLHHRWRLQQENELKQKKRVGMSAAAIQHFVDMFLPLTYVCYEKIKADVILSIDEKHRIYTKS